MPQEIIVDEQEIHPESYKKSIQNPTRNPSRILQEIHTNPQEQKPRLVKSILYKYLYGCVRVLPMCHVTGRTRHVPNCFPVISFWFPIIKVCACVCVYVCVCVCVLCVCVCVCVFGLRGWGCYKGRPGNLQSLDT